MGIEHNHSGCICLTFLCAFKRAAQRREGEAPLQRAGVVTVLVATFLLFPTVCFPQRRRREAPLQRAGVEYNHSAVVDATF